MTPRAIDQSSSIDLIGFCLVRSCTTLLNIYKIAHGGLITCPCSSSHAHNGRLLPVYCQTLSRLFLIIYHSSPTAVTSFIYFFLQKINQMVIKLFGFWCSAVIRLCPKTVIYKLLTSRRRREKEKWLKKNQFCWHVIYNNIYHRKSVRQQT